MKIVYNSLVLYFDFCLFLSYYALMKTVRDIMFYPCSTVCQSVYPSHTLVTHLHQLLLKLMMHQLETLHTFATY